MSQKYGTPTTAPAKIPTKEYDTIVDKGIEKLGTLYLPNRQSIKPKVMLLTQGEGDFFSIVNAVTAFVVDTIPTINLHIPKIHDIKSEITMHPANICLKVSDTQVKFDVIVVTKP